MKPENARANLREVISLMLDAVEPGMTTDRSVCHHFSRWTNSGDLAKLHVDAGLLKTFDFALPQAWFDAYCAWQALSVPLPDAGYALRSVVWCYDSARTFGAPYALTARAQHALEAFLASPVRRRG